MDGARRARDPGERQVPCANERWKRRWGAVLQLSLLAAAAGHLALFAAWPAREISPPETLSPLSGLQVVQLASHAAPPAPRDNTSLTQPDPREVEIPIQARDERDDGAADELLDRLTPALPSLANTRLTSAADGAPQFSARTEMIAGRRLMVGSMPGSSVRSFTWPEIRNPGQLIRFLRSRYNPIHMPAVAERKVGVAISIDEKGAVEWSGVLESSGLSAIDEIALAVVNDVIEFTPGSREGVPVPVVVVLSIPFQIRW